MDIINIIHRIIIIKLKKTILEKK